MELMRLVLIEWLDSHVAVGGWKELRGFAPSAPICRSVGWLAQDGPQSKVIVPHVIDEQGDVPLQGCGDMTIPTAAIVKMVDLKAVGSRVRSQQPIQLEGTTASCGSVPGSARMQQRA